MQITIVFEIEDVFGIHFDMKDVKALDGAGKIADRIIEMLG